MGDSGLSKLLDRSKRPLAIVLILGLAVRLILLPILTFELDLGYWLRITGLLDSGFGLYDTVGYYYTPIWGYIVALFSTLGYLIGISDLGTFVPELTQFTTGVYFISDYVVSPAYAVMMKIPIIMADIVTAFLLYGIVKDITGDERKSLMAFSLWYLCPFVILISSVHGMFDSISAMLIVLTIVFIHKRNYFFGGVTFALSVLTKFFPIFFIFFLVAYVLKREGIDRHGLKHLTIAIVGSLITVVLVQLPAIINGQFWESLSFLTSRLGLSTDTMYALSSPRMLMVWCTILIALVLLGLWLYRVKYRRFKECIVAMDSKTRDRLVIRSLFTIGGVLTLGVFAYSLLTVGGGTLMGVLVSISMKFVTLFSIYALLLEIYIAYRLLVEEELNEKSVFTALMLSSLMIFLWPALPQYLVVIVPFLVLYAVLVDEGFLGPFRYFSRVLFAYECIVLNASVLFTIAVYTDLVPIDVPIFITECASYVFMGIPVSVPILAVIVVFEYLGMLRMFQVWNHNKGVPIHAK